MSLGLLTFWSMRKNDINIIVYGLRTYRFIFREKDVRLEEE